MNAHAKFLSCGGRQLIPTNNRFKATQSKSIVLLCQYDWHKSHRQAWPTFRLLLDARRTINDDREVLPPQLQSDREIDSSWFVRRTGQRIATFHSSLPPIHLGDSLTRSIETSYSSIRHRYQKLNVGLSEQLTFQIWNGRNQLDVGGSGVS